MEQTIVCTIYFWNENSNFPYVNRNSERGKFRLKRYLDCYNLSLDEKQFKIKQMHPPPPQSFYSSCCFQISNQNWAFVYAEVTTQKSSNSCIWPRIVDSCRLYDQKCVTLDHSEHNKREVQFQFSDRQGTDAAFNRLFSFSFNFFKHSGGSWLD